MCPYNLILIRHGQSEWNLANRFTGWADIDLSEKGKQEAKKAGEVLKKIDFRCDFASASFLKRSIRTLWIMLDEMDQMWIPVFKSWRLNERHYGSLTGLDKEETMKKYGEEQVYLWRKDYYLAPPPISSARNKELLRENIGKAPLGESLKETQYRVLPLWNDILSPIVKKGKNLLIVGHGNSLRALIKHLEKLSPADIMKVEVATGTPIAYTLSEETLEVTDKKILSLED